MKKLRQTFLSLPFSIIILSIFTSCSSGTNAPLVKASITSDLDIIISPEGNSWTINDHTQNPKLINSNGIQNWKDPNTIIRTYVKLNASGELHIGLNAKSPTGSSKIKITVGDKSVEYTLKDTEYTILPIDKFPINTTGYHYIEIQGLSKEGANFGDIKDLRIGGSATKSGVTFVQDDFYWGRRGPSVHLSYETPDKDIQWSYSEITVPEGEDTIGSYYMANGFAQGYFGMQVNSPTERRVLFSVWSPYETDNPNEIPEDSRIILLGKGQGVTTGSFGNEGSGGQSYKVFNWKAGNTYRFLLKGEPSVNNSTDYTAYFFAPETEKWTLIASFRRPHTFTYLKRLHSFLENFSTNTGFIGRKAFYGNQWARDKEGNWYELTNAKFTADATARKGSRLDYAGGSQGNVFYMQNCGFFSNDTPIDSQHSRSANGTPPTIDFNTLEIPSL